MEIDPKISRDPDPPPSGSLRLDIAAPSPPPDVPIAWAETHSCVQRTFRPSSSEPIQHRWDGQRELHLITASIWDGRRSVTRSTRFSVNGSKCSRSDALAASTL